MAHVANRIAMGLVLVSMAAPAPVWAQHGVRPVLHSLQVDTPTDSRTFPPGPAVDAVNNDCLTCHSVGMVMTQPAMSKAAWEAEVKKMIAVYGAPIAAEDVPKIVDYLVATRGPTSRTEGN